MTNPVTIGDAARADTQGAETVTYDAPSGALKYVLIAWVLIITGFAVWAVAR